MKTQLIFIAILFMATACDNKKPETPEQWSDEELSEWYESGVWRHGFHPVPDETINQREMAIRYHRNPERWEKAFKFLAQENLSQLQKGRHELDGNNLFAMVDEYQPKSIEEAQYESHRIYADIQYVVSGEELISVVPLDQTVITTAYDEERDIMMLASPVENNRMAAPGRFFVFFPNDAHRPSVRTEDSTLVRKVVVKVRLE